MDVCEEVGLDKLPLVDNRAAEKGEVAKRSKDRSSTSPMVSRSGLVQPCFLEAIPAAGEVASELWRQLDTTSPAALVDRAVQRSQREAAAQQAKHGVQPVGNIVRVRVPWYPKVLFRRRAYRYGYPVRPSFYCLSRHNIKCRISLRCPIARVGEYRYRYRVPCTRNKNP